MIDINILGVIATRSGTLVSVGAVPGCQTPQGRLRHNVRNDLCALFSLYQVCVDGVEDLGVKELASRKGS